MKDEALLRWRKGSRSGSTSDCVEVPQTVDRIRDSKNKAVVLMVGQVGWSAFLSAAKNGELDIN